jgi:hypothetical protein
LLTSAKLVRFGRQPDVEVQLSDPNISRVHAAIELGDKAHALHDLGSRNGTFLADLRLAANQTLTLPAAGVVRFGEDSIFAFTGVEGGVDLVPQGRFDNMLRVHVRRHAIEIGPWHFAFDDARHAVTCAAPFLLNGKRVGSAELLRGDIIETQGVRWEIVG